MFGETKYSTSFFNQQKKLNVNSKLADLKLGFTDDAKGKEQAQKIICLKGGEDAPKIFNRFTNVDAPER
jgi:hypothetical protein